MNVLSLFDGISCAQIALNRAGIKADNYYASEIKPSAIKTTQKHYPNTIQLGDVLNIDVSKLPKIDLMFFCSPCQDLSQVNKERKGLLGAKSSLFYRAYEIFKQVKPSYFLMENVLMDKADYETISQCLEVYPIEINSSLVSAQSRPRLYWTNIGDFTTNLFGEKICSIPLPKDKGIELKDILLDGYTDLKKARCLLASGGGIGYKDMRKKYERYIKYGFTNLIFKDKSLRWDKGTRDLYAEELEKLQTLPKGYLNGLAYKEAVNLAGDGWTVDVIAHILSFLLKGKNGEKAFEKNV
jgi:DNA (cytosine-5)-methyltransferase 3A